MIIGGVEFGFRPLSGLCSSNSGGLLSMKQRLIVSVPFRGYVVVIARRATSALNMCFRPLSGLCSSNNRVDAWGMDIWDGFRPLSGLCSSNCSKSSVVKYIRVK